MTKRNMLINTGFLVGLSLVLLSCYRSPDATIYQSDLDVVSTSYNNEIDFKSFLTYHITDSFFVASNVDDIDEDAVNDPEFRFRIKSQIKANMDAFGYQFIDDPENVDPDDVDLIINVTVLYINQKGVVYYPIYWSGGGYGGYYGYPYYWGWGGGWNYYWTWVPSYYNYDVGSLVVDILDFKNRDTVPITPDSSRINMEIAWSSGMTGIPDSKVNYDRLLPAIDQSFLQSPYLNRNE